MQSQVRSAMENPFWDNIASGLAQEPPDFKRAVDLVEEVREELEALVPHSWKDELREFMDLELITQVRLHTKLLFCLADVGNASICYVVLNIYGFFAVEFGVWEQ